MLHKLLLQRWLLSRNRRLRLLLLQSALELVHHLHRRLSQRIDSVQFIRVRSAQSRVRGQITGLAEVQSGVLARNDIRLADGRLLVLLLLLLLLLVLVVLLLRLIWMLMKIRMMMVQAGHMMIVLQLTGVHLVHRHIGLVLILQLSRLLLQQMQFEHPLRLARLMQPLAVEGHARIQRILRVGVQNALRH